MEIKHTKKKIDKVETEVSDTKTLLEHDAPDSPVSDVNWHANQVSAKSEVHLEDDQGQGDPVILRMFEFSANPETFKLFKPSKQDLFNSHAKFMEVSLWRDGMAVVPDIEPRVILSKRQMKYKIFVGARPMKGQLLLGVSPKRLTELKPK